MAHEQAEVSLAKSQAKRVMRELRILVQMLARIEEDLQTQEVTR